MPTPYGRDGLCPVRRSLLASVLLAACIGGVALAGETRITGAVAGKVTISSDDFWSVKDRTKVLEKNLEVIRIDLTAQKKGSPKPFSVRLGAPMGASIGYWRTDAHFNKFVPQTWRGWSRATSDLASQAPVAAFFDDTDGNVLTVACSESLRKVKYTAGVDEDARSLAATFEFFREAEAPIDRYSVEVRVDRRQCFYGTSIGDAFEWCRAALDGKPVVPDAAFDPIYSTWYSYHQNVSDKIVERECAAAAKLGMKTVIVDDGWQTDDNRGGYAYCGDWVASTNRFPDFRAHVENVHRLGMRYVLWYSVPFIGKKSANFKRFKGKYLYVDNGHRSVGVLDPRFPEVRAFLIGIFEKALIEEKLDGFKLDFIDSFHFQGGDPAVKENYAGRDIRSLPQAVDRLMIDLGAALRKIKPDVLLEFRQSYIGPAMQRYGNMLRVSDCAYGLLQNRTGTLDLRLSSGPDAVHSDMIIWMDEAPPAVAALQFWNVLFSVPQISVRLNEISPDQRKMLKRCLDFWLAHCETLMHGELRPLRPDLNYPIVYAYGKGEQVIAVYDGNAVVNVDPARGRAYIVNATGAKELVVRTGDRSEVVPVDPSGYIIR